MAFTSLPNEAIDRMTEISAGALRLYLFLLRCRNQTTGKCCPSVRVTAEAIDVHPKNIFKLRNELTSAGWARFDGDTATELLGTIGSKNTTPEIAPIEVAPKSSKNATVRVRSSKNATRSSKNTTAESQKHYPVVAKTLLNGSKNATAYKEEQDEGTRRIEQDEILSGAVAPQAGLRPEEFYSLFVELYRTVGGYDAPYQCRKADFVHRAQLYANCERTSWPLTVQKVTQAAKNFFATPRSSHTLADFAAHFSDFFKHAFDRFGKPVEENGNGRTKVPRNETYGERVGRQMEELAQRTADTYAPTAFDSGADTADTGTPWLAVEVGGF